MPWPQVNQFVNLARQADKSANTNKSALYPLIQVLQGANPTAAAVRTALNNIPAGKQQKYQAALNFLRGNFPGLVGGGPVAGGVNVLAGANAQVLQGVRGGLGRVTAAQQAAPGVAAAPAGAVAVAGAIPPQGWSLIDDPDAFTLLPAPSCVPAFTGVQIARINEAVRRTKRAVDVAIQEISHLAVPAAGAPAPAADTPAERYARFFGPLTNVAADVTRKTSVLGNFQSMAGVLLGARGVNMSGLRFIDSRNDTQKKDWFAATVRGSAVGRNHVNVYIGRTFFLATGDFRQRGHVMGDATVVTLVHELAHAVFSASDVPIAGSGQVLDAAGMPPRGAAVANDSAADVALAAASPALALLNADNYGQFAFEALEAARQ